MILDYSETEDYFFLHSSYDERELAHGLGFRWNHDKKHWYSKNEILARRVALRTEAAERILYNIVKTPFLPEPERAPGSVILKSPEGLYYYPFQADGIQFLVDHVAALLGDDMGLGKTIQVCGLINHLMHSDLPRPKVLIVSPASLKVNWVLELRKWLVRPLVCKTADSEYYPLTFDVLSINYDVVRKYLANLAAVNWDMVILDEAQKFKNNKTIRAKAVRAVTKELEKTKTIRKICITGTPIMNRPREVWNLLNYLDPKRFHNYKWFSDRFCGVDGKGASNLGELHKLLTSNLMIRRRKQEVLKDLPQKTRQVIELPSEGLEDLIKGEVDIFNYKLGLSYNLSQLSSASPKVDDISGFFSELSKIKPGILAGNLFKIRHEVALRKVPLAIEHVNMLLDSECQKVVVFAHHQDVIEQLRAAFPGSACVIGASNGNERAAAVSRFQSDPACRVFIGSLMAAQLGLTLTASSNVVFVEIDFVPANLLQAEDRVYRIGQNENVLIQYLVLEGSSDAIIMRMLATKLDIISQAVDGERIDG